jgi:hypothetical protein
MRIICGVLAAFASFVLVFLIAGAGREWPFFLIFMTFFGGAALVLLWLAAGQPLTFAAAATTELKTWQRRFRRGMRIAAGVFGVPLAVQLIAVVSDLPWKAISSARTGATGSGALSMALEYLPSLAVWWVPQGLTAWVLLRFAFRGRPLPPIKPALTPATPSAGPSVAGDEAGPENGPISVVS